MMARRRSSSSALSDPNVYTALPAHDGEDTDTHVYPPPSHDLPFLGKDTTLPLTNANIGAANTNDLEWDGADESRRGNGVALTRRIDINGGAREDVATAGAIMDPLSRPELAFVTLSAAAVLALGAAAVVVTVRKVPL